MTNLVKKIIETGGFSPLEIEIILKFWELYAIEAGVNRKKGIMKKETIADRCKKAGISRATYYHRLKKLKKSN